MKKLISLSFVALLCQFASFAQCTIYGTLGTCIGNSIFLSMDSACIGGTGGVWSSSNPTVATISSYGYVSGVSAGTTTISYVSGSVVSTAVVTVYPAPTAITGPSSVCVGSYITMADATPGGTWSSSNPGIASVVPTTGVVSGVSGGTCYIYYTTGTGCSVYTTVTVGSSVLYDSLYGPTSVCSGASISLTSTIGGGTWSSSNTAIATVNATTGVVTGVSTGLAEISYALTGSCGVAYDYTAVNVNPTITAGSIYGTTTAVVGGTANLYDYPSGGTWVSTNPAIATVSSTGLVTGVAVGSVTIEYIVYGCVNTDTAFTTFTVTILDKISGTVNFGSTYVGNVKVWLITFNTATLDLEASDSVSLYCTGTSVAYQFTGMPTDSFRVKAAAFDSLGTSTGYVPTYHDSSLHWNTANVIYHTYGTADLFKNIHMRTGTVTTGPGFIAGNVMTGADKGTSGGVPVVGMIIYVVDQTTGAQLQKTLTDASGNYSFSNLPVGATYLIYPEAINYLTTAYTSITLTTAIPSMSAAGFIQHTISKTITPIPASVNNVNTSLSSVCVFPNPTTGTLNLQWNAKNTEKGLITVSDMTGREMFKTSIEMELGKGSTQLDLSYLPQGLYLVSVKTGSINYNTEISVNKN